MRSPSTLTRNARSSSSYRPPGLSIRSTCRLTSLATSGDPLVDEPETWPGGEAASDAGLGVTVPAGSVDGGAAVGAAHDARVSATAAASRTWTNPRPDRLRDGWFMRPAACRMINAVSYTHLRAHETD